MSETKSEVKTVGHSETSENYEFPQVCENFAMSNSEFFFFFVKIK